MNFQKISLIAFLFFILMSLNVFASNEILNPKTGDVYNLGDNIIINGQLSISENVAGVKVSFYAYSKTYNKTITITTKYYSFSKNIPVTFSQINKETLSWNVPSDIQTATDWQILVRATKDFITYGAIDSPLFTISKTLSITLSTNQNLFNLGETLEVGGMVLDAQGNVVEGDATITLDEEKVGTVVSDIAFIKNGYLSYTYQFKPVDPIGIYTLSVKLQDSDGNKGSAIFTNINVSNTLDIECSVKESEILPGKSITLIGNIKNVHSGVLRSIPIIGFFEMSENTTLGYNTISDANGKFSLEIGVPILIDPGEYQIKVSANDFFGNYGECIKTIKILSEKKISAILSLDRAWYYKDDTLSFNAELRSGSNLDVSGNIDLYIDSSKVLSKDFEILKGALTTANGTLKVAFTLGNHTARILVSSGEEVLYETEPLTFAVYERPKPKEPFQFKPVHALIIIIILIAVFLYFAFKRDIKEYFWRRELQKHFQKRGYSYKE